MGYLTNYSLYKISGSDENYEKLVEEIYEKTDLDFVSYEFQESTWGNHEEDLISLSKKYPDLVIGLDGSGENYEDLWHKRFRNGDCECVRTEYPPFVRITSEDERITTLRNTLEKTRNTFLSVIKTMVKENGKTVDGKTVLEFQFIIPQEQLYNTYIESFVLKEDEKEPDKLTILVTKELKKNLKKTEEMSARQALSTSNLYSLAVQMHHAFSSPFKNQKS